MLIFNRNNKIFSRLLLSLFLVCFLSVAILPNIARAAVTPSSTLLSPTATTLLDQNGASVTAYGIGGSKTASGTGNALYYSTATGNYYEFVPGYTSGGNSFKLFTADDATLNSILAQAQTNASTGTTGGSMLDFRIPVVGHIVGAILYIVQWALGKLIYTAGMLLDSVLGIKNFTKVGIVQHGWTVIRDLCNMIFALILLIIAFATILHIETYGMKQLLWKLVVAAILINFSFTLAGIIIDFSQVLTVFFVENSKGAANGQQISATLILDGLKFNKLLTYDSQYSSGGVWNWVVSALGGPTIGTIIDMLIIIILLAVALFAVFGLVILFLVRIVVLWIILIFAPLAWLCMVLPSTQSIWNKWWDYLLKYSFFAPFSAFMLYLAILFIQNGDLTKIEGIQQASLSHSQYLSSYLNNPMFIMQYILVIGLLLASVLVAKNMGIMGASAVISMGKGAKALALGAIAGVGIGASAWAGRRALVATGGAVGEEGTRWAATADRWRQTQGWRAVVARPAAFLAGQASRLPTMYSERARQEVAKQEKTYSSWSTTARMREIPLASPAARAALLKLEAENLTAEHERYLPEMRRIGGDVDSVLVHKPQWAGKDIDHWVTEARRKGVVSKWKADTTGNVQVLAALKKQMPTGAFVNVVDGWAGEIRQSSLSAMKTQFSGDFTNDANVGWRKAYAHVTGNLDEAFSHNGAVDQTNQAQIKAFKEHVQTLKPAQMGSISVSPNNAYWTAQFITPGQVSADRGEISPQMKSLIKQAARNLPANSAAKKAINNTDNWNTTQTQQRNPRTPKP